MRRPAALALLLLLALPAGAAAADADTGVRVRAALATAKYWRPWYDRPDAWLSQLWAESRFNSDAVSPVGACGIAQFMPATRREVLRLMGLPAEIPCTSLAMIDAGAFYMARLRKHFPIAADEEERQRMMRAAYNAGPGWIIKARRYCDADTWGATAPCLERFTGRHAAETKNYVAAIEKTIRDCAETAKRTLRPKRARRSACGDAAVVGSK